MSKDMRDIYVVAARRTAIGSFGGSLKDMPLVDLATLPVRDALAQSGVAPEQIGQVIIGNVVVTEPRDPYLARVAALQSGIPNACPAYNVSRLCGSGLQAIISAAHCIQMGDAEVAIGGGAESMSRGPYLVPAARWGARLGNATLIDYMNSMLHDPIGGYHMGVTAENVSARYGITRQMQDELALESQRRAVRALKEGRFAGQITPVELKTRKGMVSFSVDENPRADATLESLAGLKPVFQKDGTVTAGNASGINDGAAALVLASGEMVSTLGLKPLARMVSYAYSGVEPEVMGIGPISATRSALARAGLQVKDLDVIESNEAFAAQACAVMRTLDFDPDKVNPNGSGISLGHPVGATGAILATKLIYELQRTGGRYGLTTMCIGGGQGIAVVWEGC